MDVAFQQKNDIADSFHEELSVSAPSHVFPPGLIVISRPGLISDGIWVSADVFPYMAFSKAPPVVYRRFDIMIRAGIAAIPSAVTGYRKDRRQYGR